MFETFKTPYVLNELINDYKPSLRYFKQKSVKSLKNDWNIAVIRILLKQQMDDKSFREERRVTFQEVSEVTGISKPTLTRIANVPGYSATTDTIDALCDYFDCEPGDILVRVKK